MTAKAQQAAIEKAMGWEPRSIALTMSNQSNYWNFNGKYHRGHPPSYTTDLNAMHEVLESGTIRDWPKYICFLAKVLIGNCSPRAAGNDYHVATSILLCATAAQQAEAYLRAKHLWTEDSEP